MFMRSGKYPGRKTLMSTLLILILTAAAFSPLGALDVPRLQGRVNDHASVLSSASVRQLEDYLASVESSSGAQIVFLTIPSLEGESLESYALKVAETWGLGSKDREDGVLLLVSMAERKIRIEVGYGLEGVLTDAMSGYIIREAIVPEFKRGRFNAGIAAGLQAIGGLAAGDIVIDQTAARESASRQSSSGSGAAGFFIMVLFFMIFGSMGRYRRYRRRGMSPLAAFALGSLMGSSRRSSGGFSGGGFSGGGGFGGGGASGGW